MNPSGLFQLESQQNTLVITPLLDMGEFNCDQIQEEGKALLAEVDTRPEASIVIDFSQTDYFGSDALGLFVQLWKKASQRGGRLAFCGASDYGVEILQRAKFDHIGPICATRAEALAALLSSP
jgi:anti-anti-sigma factor